MVNKSEVIRKMMQFLRLFVSSFISACWHLSGRYLHFSPLIGIISNSYSMFMPCKFDKSHCTFRELQCSRLLFHRIVFCAVTYKLNCVRLLCFSNVLKRKMSKMINNRFWNVFRLEESKNMQSIIMDSHKNFQSFRL